MASGIYQILNTANGKRYVGSAADFAKRFSLHRRDLAKGAHHSQILQRAWDKYGPAAFEFHVLINCERSKDSLEANEQMFIDALKPEYNICKTAGTCLGVKHSPETRAKVSAALRGRNRDPVIRANISAARKGMVFSPEHCASMARVRIGKPGNSPSSETRARTSATLMGHAVSADARAKMSAAATGRVVSPETRAKMSAAQTARYKQLQQGA